MPAILRLNNINALQIFQLLRFAAFFITGMGLAKSGLSLSDIGIFESLMFISGILSFFWVSGILNTLLSTFDKKANQQQQGVHLFNAFLLLILASVIVFFVLRLFESQILMLLADTLQLDHFKLFTWYILLNNPLFLVEYIFLLKDKPRHTVVFGIVNFILLIAVVLLPLYFGFSLNESIFGLVILAGIKFLFLIGLLSKHAVARFDKREITLIATIALPLVFSLLMSGSAEYIDQWIVSKFLGKEQLAIFRYGARELPVSLLLANALSVGMIPYLKENLLSSESLKEIKKKTVRLLHFLFPVSIVLMLSSRYLYPVFFSNVFIESATIFNIYLLLISTRMLFPQTILLAVKDTKTIFWISLIEIILNVSLSLFLLQKIGILGIAWGTIIAYTVEKALLMFVVYHKHGILPGNYTPWKYISIYTLILCLAFAITTI